MSQVKVFGTWSSTFVTRVEMALRLKGVEYEFIEEDLRNKSPLLLKYNPVHKKVPVMVHNDKPIAESGLIVEYIDEVWEGPSILPQHPYERARARFWAKFIDDKCTYVLWRACWSKGEESEKAKEEGIEALKFLEKEMDGKKFFGGDTIGYVDIYACFILHWFPIIQEMMGLQIMTQHNFPNLMKWADEYCNNSFVKEVLPHKDRLIEIYKGYQLIVESGQPMRYN